MTPGLFFQIVSIEARKRMTYRADFWISSVGSVLAHFTVAWFLWKAVYGSAPGAIGGFSFEAMLLYYVIVILLGQVVRGFSLDIQVSVDIYEGGLTRYLLFPTSYFPFKYAQHVGALVPAVAQLVAFALLFVAFIGIPADVHLSLGRVAAAVVSIAIANLLYFQMNLPLQSVSFWADNVWSLSVALRMLTSLLGGMLLPLTLFPGWAQDALAWTPFPLLFDAPARMLLGKLSFEAWGQLVGVAAIWMVFLAAITQQLWRRGRLQYTGVGI